MLGYAMRHVQIRLLAFIFLCVLALCTPGSAADHGDFAPFVAVDLSPPDGVKHIDDPTGTAPEKQVDSFTLKSGYCGKASYRGSKDTSDCTFRSSRSQVREDVFATKKYGNVQPKQAWYGWSVFFPEDFAFGKRQTEGNFHFFYWHNARCAHLAFTNQAGRDDALYMNTSQINGKDGFECTPGPRMRVADFKDLVGKWNKFEVFVKWAHDDTGEVKVYLNGKYIIHYRGANLTEGVENINYFVYGIYLCCTKDVKEIKGTNVLYANVKRANTREELTGVPKGTFDTQKDDVALLSFPNDADSNLVADKANYTVHTVESLAMKSGKDSQVNTTFTSRVLKHPTVKTVNFNMLGQFNFNDSTFYDFAFYFHDNLKDTKALAACGSDNVLTFPDGTKHAWLHFTIIGNKFSAQHPDCVIAAVPKPLGTNIAFLVDNFPDVVAGMAKDGTISLVSHEGLRAFLKRAASGEVQIGR